MSKCSEHQNLTKFVKTYPRTQKKTRKIHSQMWMHIKHGEEKKSRESIQNQVEGGSNYDFKQQKLLCDKIPQNHYISESMLY